MKIRKFLVSIFASLFTISSIVALTSCNNNQNDDPKDNPSGENPGGENPGGETPSTSDEDIVNAAMNALTVQATADADFTLTVKGNGNVNISWASNNTDVITINGNKAVVTAPFGGEDVTVKLTATLVLNDVTKTKDFNVIVSAIADESKSIADVKALADDTATTVRGVVTGFLYASGTTDPEYKRGYYVTDETGTIYVFDQSSAANLNDGDEVYLNATKTTYSNVAQLSQVSTYTVLSSNATPDWTSVITDKTIAQIAESENIGGNVYEFVGKVFRNTYGAYSLDDLSGSGSLSVYFSGSSSMDLVYYGSELKDKIEQIVKVKFVVNSANSSGKWRGNVLEVVSLTAAEQAQYISQTIKNTFSLDDKITQATTINLLSEIAYYDACSISWSLKSGSAGATIENNVLTVTPTDDLQTFTLVATVTVEGITDPVVIEFNEVMVKNSFEAISYEDYLAAQLDSYVFVEGVVVSYDSYNSQYKNCNLILQNVNGNGGYYIYRFPCEESDLQTGGKYAIGTTLKIYGQIDEYAGQRQINAPSASDIEIVAEASNLPQFTNITATVEAELKNYANKLVTIDQLYYNGTTLVAANGNEFKIGKSDYTDSLVSGKVYKFDGVLSYYNGYTLVMVSDVSFTEVTENIDLAFLPNVLNSLFASSYTADATVNVPTTFGGKALTYTVNAESTTVSYADGVVTITASASETSTITVTAEGVAEPVTTINVVISLGLQTVTVVSPNNDIQGSQQDYSADHAAELGVDSNALSIMFAKNDSSGIGYYEELRLYNDKTGGNGSAITISAKAGYAIDSIVVTYSSATYMAAAQITAAEVVAGTADANNSLKITYAVNGDNVEIKCVSTSSRVYIDNIVINYKTVA